MKIAVLGAGAMGCLYGFYLSNQYEVVLLDSYIPQIEAINKNGLHMIENGEEKVVFPKAVMSGTNIGVVDIIIVFVKAIHTYEAVQNNLSLIGKDTIVITLQNGAGNDRDILNFVKKENIVIGTSKHNSVTSNLGEFKHTAFGVTTIGPMGDTVDSVVKAGQVLENAGLEVDIAEDIQRIIWSKLLVNMSINTLTALLETKIGFMVKNLHAWDFAKRIIYEGVEVAEADGTYFDRREALNMVKKVCEEAAAGYSSMYQDRKKKIRTEIDKINGAVVEQAKMYGVPTPYNSLVVDLIHAIEGTYDEID
ncbi:MAG: 2-dehydropantoate 2-reductase [Lachnotalea sp.]